MEAAPARLRGPDAARPEIPLPEALANRGLSLRPETPEDAPFLAALFASVRGPEFEGNGWSDEVRHAFLADQFRLQVAHYARCYADADFLIVERQGAPIGRLYMHRGPREHRIVDISLLPEVRNRGIGGASPSMSRRTIPPSGSICARVSSRPARAAPIG